MITNLNVRIAEETRAHSGQIFARVLSGKFENVEVKTTFFDPKEYHDTKADIEECVDYQLPVKVLQRKGTDTQVCSGIAVVTRGVMHTLITAPCPCDQ